MCHLIVSEYGGDVLLDIQFSGDKRSIGLINNFVCWKDIKQQMCLIPRIVKSSVLSITILQSMAG